MKIFLEPYVIESKTKGKFYVIRYVLKDGDEVVATSKPLLWLTEEQYNKYVASYNNNI